MEKQQKIMRRKPVGKLYLALAIVIIAIFCLSFTSAAWDVITSTNYEKAKYGYPEITLNDWFNFPIGEEIFKGSLIEHTASCSANCESIIKVQIKKGLPYYDGIKFIKVNTNKEVNIYSYKIEKKVIKGQIEVPTYEYVCIYDKPLLNGSMPKVCEHKQIGTTLQDDIIWEEITPATKSDGKQTEIKISGSKNPLWEIDWILTSQGESLNDWATWGGTTLKTDLEGYWTLDEGTGTVAYNSVDNTTHNLTLTGTNWVESGKIIKAYTPALDKANTGLNFSGNMNISINMWIKRLDNRTAIGKFFANNGGPVMGSINLQMPDANRDQINIVVYDTGWKTMADTPTPLNTWMMVTMTVNSSNVYLYINGTYRDKLNVAFTDIMGAYFYLMSMPDEADPITLVSMDEIGIWSREITPSEITSLYNSYAGLNYSSFADVGSITLNSPANEYSTISTAIDFNCSASTISPVTLVNRSIWTNKTGTWQITNTSAINGQLISVPFSLGNYNWTCSACDSDGDCGVSSSNRTLSIVPAVINSVTYSNSTLGATSTFTANVSAEGTESVTATFTYGGVLYSTSKTGDNANMLFTNTLPSNTAGSIPFYWNITSGSSRVNSNIYTQTVSPLNLTNCSQGGSIIFNFTVYDEDSLARFDENTNNMTIEISMEVRSLGGVPISNYSNKALYANPLLVCTSATLGTSPVILDATVKYAGNGSYISEFYHIQNFTLTGSTLSQNISLYDLLVERAQEFKITYKDSSFLPVVGAMLDLQRKYVGDGVFRTVESPAFDNGGSTLANLVLGDIKYTLVVKKDNQILGTFDNVLAYCDNVDTGDCQINLNSYSSTIQTDDYSSSNGIIFTMSYNDATRTFQSIFSTADGSTQTLYMNVSVFDAYGNNTVCSDMLTSSSGTLSCIVPNTYGNTTLIASLYKKGSQISLGTLIKRLYATGTAAYGGSIVTIAFIGFLTIVGMGLSASGVWILVFAILGLMVMGSMFIFSGGGLLGVGSAITWLIIAILVIIWKISKREQP